VRLAGPHLLLPLRPRDGERPGAGEDAQPFPEGPRRGPHPIPPAGSYWEDTAGWGTQASGGDPGGQEGADDGGAQPWPGRGSERSDGVGSTFSVGEVLELPSRRICSRISKSTADSLCPGDPRGGEGCAQGPPHQQLCLLSFPISAINDITAYFQGSRAWDGDPE